MNKIILIYVFLFCIFAFTFFCSKNNDPASVLEKLRSLVQEKKFNDVKQLLSSGSLKKIDDLNRNFPGIYSWKADFVRQFPEDSRWDIVEKSVKSETAWIKMKCKKHPVENIKGFETQYNLILENNKWKIDIEKQLQEMSQGLKNYKGEDYTHKAVTDIIKNR